MDRQAQNSAKTQGTLSGEDRWYVFKNEQKYGPLRYSDLAQFVQEKSVLEDDWVWKPGLASWIAAADVSGLFVGHARDDSTQSGRSATVESGKSEHGRNFKDNAKHQLKEYATMFVYLWVVFGLLAIHESIVLEQHQIDFRPHGIALINALIFAKVMLIAEDMHPGRRLDDGPLVYSILFKSIVFAIALICFHFAEHVIIGMWHGRTMAESIAEVGANNLKEIVSIGLIATIALVPFFILRDIRRVIGEDYFRSLFFHRRKGR